MTVEPVAQRGGAEPARPPLYPPLTTVISLAQTTVISLAQLADINKLLTHSVRRFVVLGDLIFICDFFLLSRPRGGLVA